MANRRAGPDAVARKARRKAENVDILIGFLGFFGVLLLVATVVAELTAQPAAGWALLLLAVSLGMWGLLRLRRRLPEPGRARRFE